MLYSQKVMASQGVSSLYPRLEKVRKFVIFFFFFAKLVEASEACIKDQITNKHTSLLSIFKHWISFSLAFIIKRVRLNTSTEKFYLRFHLKWNRLDYQPLFRKVGLYMSCRGESSQNQSSLKAQMRAFFIIISLFCS